MSDCGMIAVDRAKPFDVIDFVFLFDLVFVPGTELTFGEHALEIDVSV